MNKTTKTELVTELKTSFDKMKAAVLTDFRGIKVESITEFRKEIRKNGCKYAVVKNTLAQIACKDTTASPLKPYFKGPVGMAYTDKDPVSLAKVLKKYSETEQNLKVNVGYLEGKIISVKEVKALADMPSKEILIGQLVGTFAAPIKGLMNVLTGPTRNFVGVLDAIKRKKENL